MKENKNMGIAPTAEIVYTEKDKEFVRIIFELTHENREKLLDYIRRLGYAY